MVEVNKYETKYYASRTIEDIILELKTNIKNGLSTVESKNRLIQFGLNIIPIHKKIAWWQELLVHFKSPLIILLLIASIISIFLSEALNASIIFVMVLLSIGIDFFQERDARNAAEKLQDIVKTKVTVLRDGVVQEAQTMDIFPGDIIHLNAGKIVPADARILTEREFYVNQSSLTGESFPSQKQSDALPGVGQELSEMGNIVFMGSSVVSGNASAVVIKTGGETEFGKIAEKLISREEESDFGKGMKSFGYLIMKSTIILVLFIFFINALMKQNILESFMFSIAVAVGLTPELLPMIMSLTMSRGSIEMAKKGVIVKRLSAIPNFGSMDVLCTDKTGTLTEDKIKLIKCVDGYGSDSKEVFKLAYLNSFFQTGIKNPLDDAIIDYGKPDISLFTKRDEIPFDFYRKRMSVVVKTDDKNILICKGAPEEIMKISVNTNTFSKEAFLLYEKLSSDGFRVLAIATKNIQEQSTFSKLDESNLLFQGFVAFLDPPKEDADDIIHELESIGVEVKIITGDNHLVTQKICKEINLNIKGVMQGYEMDTITDDALSKRVLQTTIFTRFSPEQKNRIINALKSHHRAVGYLGDGINDAPSLKAADIGISVNSATDVAKESADIILSQKSLLVLKEGILQGRKTFGNTMKYVMMGISSNFGNMFSVAAATLFLPFLPMLPVQILINNFLYDFSQISIPSDNVDDDYIKIPRRWNMKMIYRYMLVFGITSSIFDLLTFWILYTYFNVTEAQFRTGWFMESLATQILVVFIIRTEKVPFYKSIPSKKLLFSTGLFLLVGWSLPYLPFSGRIGFEALPLHIILYLTLLVFVYLFSAEMMKRFINKKWQASSIGTNTILNNISK